MPGRLVHIPLWWVIVGAFTAVLTPIFTIYASVQINKHTIAENERARAQVLVEATNRYCRLIASQIDVYSDATTPVGRNAYETWLTEYRIQKCQPERS
jgi:hypothetical protein